MDTKYNIGEKKYLVKEHPDTGEIYDIVKEAIIGLNIRKNSTKIILGNDHYQEALPELLVFDTLDEAKRYAIGLIEEQHNKLINSIKNIKDY